MPTIIPIAFNDSGTPIPGTTQIGDLSIGETNQDYGAYPSGYRFWATPDLDLSYVIAFPDPTGNQPNPLSIPCYVGFYGTQNKTDLEFLGLANYIAKQDGDPQNFTNGVDAKNWLNSNGYWTSYSDVVTNGLTLQLDASNLTSYSGSGNVWYDLVAPQENITLINSPTFTAPSPSYFTFNGSNQYGVGTGPVLSPTAYTKSVWFYLNSYSDNNLVSSQDGGHFMYMAGTNKIYCGHTDWPSYGVFPSNFTFALNTWYYVALTFNTTDGMKLYVNGVLDSIYTANKSPMVGNYSTNVGAFGVGNLLNGRIARVFCYNTSLSASEVLQNYNGTVPPFISVTPTPTPTNSQTPTPSVTATPTNSQTPTQTQTETPTNTPTPSITASQTVTPTITQTPTNTASVTLTPTNSETPTNTPTVTPTPNIVTSGLVIQLDAYSNASYPGTGTTVYDLTNSYNHTLTNAPYTVLNTIKCFDCNGAVNTNIRVNTTGPTLPTSGYTYITWVRFSNITTYWRTLFRTAPNDHPMLVAIASNNLGFYDNNSSSFINSTYDISPIIDTWAQLTVVASSTGSTYYVNTTQVGNTVAYTAGGNRHDYWGSIAGQPSGYVANMYYYNRALNLAEITQQYNYLSPRFVEPTPTPTATNTPTATPTNTVTQTNTVTPTNTKTPTPTPSQTEPFFILVQSGDILTAQDGSGIEYQH